MISSFWNVQNCWKEPQQTHLRLVCLVDFKSEMDTKASHICTPETICFGIEDNPIFAMVQIYVLFRKPPLNPRSQASTFQVQTSVRFSYNNQPSTLSKTAKIQIFFSHAKIILTGQILAQGPEFYLKLLVPKHWQYQMGKILAQVLNFLFFF